MSPDSEYQTVRVGKTVPESLPVDINDAVVSISSEEQTIGFTSIGDGLYQDKQANLRLNPGQSYQLKVEMNNGKILTAETQLPETFKILSPQPGDTINHYILRPIWQEDLLQFPRMKWQESNGAAFYTITLVIARGYNFWGSSVSTYRNEIFMPDLRPHLQPPDFTIPSDTLFVDAELYVFAQDSSTRFHPGNARRFHQLIPYADYTREEFLAIFGAGGTAFDKNYYNIQGGFGKFKGSSMAKTGIVLKVHIDLDRE